MHQSKQSNLLHILHQLSPYRSSAEGLIVLLEYGNVEDKVLNTIVSIIHSSLVKVKNLSNLQKLTDISKQLQLLQDQELADRKQENAESILDDL